MYFMYIVCMYQVIKSYNYTPYTQKVWWVVLLWLASIGVVMSSTWVSTTFAISFESRMELELSMGVLPPMEREVACQYPIPLPVVWLMCMGQWACRCPGSRNLPVHGGSVTRPSSSSTMDQQSSQTPDALDQALPHFLRHIAGKSWKDFSSSKSIDSL